MQEEIVVKAPTTEALTPAQITQKAEDLGVTKTEMSFGRSFALSIMAGAFIAMGAMFFSLVVGDPALPFAIQRVLGGFLFCLGLRLRVGLLLRGLRVVHGLDGLGDRDGIAGFDGLRQRLPGPGVLDLAFRILEQP